MDAGEDSGAGVAWWERGRKGARLGARSWKEAMDQNVMWVMSRLKGGEGWVD